MNEVIPISEQADRDDNKKEKKNKELSKLVGTFFRNALRSNLDLTSLADTKAGILISINGFILTVSVTASGFAIHNTMMTYSFISIILTSLGSIIFSVMAVRPRDKHRFVPKSYLEGYESLLYYQDMANLTPDGYAKKMKGVLRSSKKSEKEMVTHLHILGSEIKKKYFWLRQAYTFFSIGLIVSASFMIYALAFVKQTPFNNLSKGNVVYTEDEFYNVFEPSGATTMPDGKVLIVEDENSASALKLIEVTENGNVVEVGALYMPKHMKKKFKKEIEDLEALASDGNIVYAITSHSLTKDNKSKEKREQFIMFTYDDGALKELHIYADLKANLYKSFPKIFKQRMFFADDFNIEGLTYDSQDAILYIGFRAPSLNSDAIVIGITNPKEVFLKGEMPKFTKVKELNLNGLGIRDMAFDIQKNGYWVLAGGVGERDEKFQLWFWDKKTSKTHHIENHPSIGFAEGITVINREGSKAKLFVVEDNGKKPNKAANYVIIERESL